MIVRNVTGFCALALALAACSDQEQSLSPTFSAAASAVPAQAGNVITDDPRAFAQAVRAARNENELIVWLKDADLAAPGASAFAENGGGLKIGLGRATAGGGRRHALGVAQPKTQARAAVRTALSAHGLRPYTEGAVLPVMMVRVPEQALDAVVRSLLNNPNVDWVEANQRHPVSLLAGPLGTNPVDIKHTLHNVEGAWDYSRGSGVKIGVLDTGLAADAYYNTDPDESYVGPYGVNKLGFVDDYPGCGDGSTAQRTGACEWRDDHGHGTLMTGLAGALDNNVGYVGMAPQAIVYSMKTLFNTYMISNNNCGGPEIRDCIEDDDFTIAVDWAANNGLDVISMSFATNSGSSVQTALSRAYTTYDVLPMAATGNVSGQAYYPAGYTYVLGVGGVNEYGASIYRDNNEDIAAFSGGGTVWPGSCSSSYPSTRCTLGGYSALASYEGGTSSSTANAAGIAALVRSYNPGLTAGQVWSRLVAASPGTAHQLDALVAVRGY
ncbi:MAG TPA: S8 family serine peptidase [Longimicrobium sp.]|nr:S8 family serine peptidase [Longimicrobium sp.]